MFIMHMMKMINNSYAFNLISSLVLINSFIICYALIPNKLGHLIFV